MTKTISLINMKGGVGKSTITTNLAWAFAAYRNWSKRVLVVDLDPQFNASQYLLGVREYEQHVMNNKPTIWDVFEQGTRTPAGVTPYLDPHTTVTRVVTFRGGSYVDLVPSQLELTFTLRNPGQKEHRLRTLLDEIESDYDLIIIDCAPTESMLTTAAYLCSDHILVPVKPEYLSSIGLPLLVNSMNNFHKDHANHSVNLAGVVFNMTSDYLPEEAQSKESVKELSQANGWYVFDSEVPFSRSFPRGAREGRPLFRTPYRRTERVRRFNRFARELATRIELL